MTKTLLSLDGFSYYGGSNSRREAERYAVQAVLDGAEVVINFTRKQHYEVWIKENTKWDKTPN